MQYRRDEDDFGRLRSPISLEIRRAFDDGARSWSPPQATRGRKDLWRYDHHHHHDIPTRKHDDPTRNEFGYGYSLRDDKFLLLRSQRPDSGVDYRGDFEKFTSYRDEDKNMTIKVNRRFKDYATTSPGIPFHRDRALPHSRYQHFDHRDTPNLLVDPYRRTGHHLDYLPPDDDEIYEKRGRRDIYKPNLMLMDPRAGDRIPLTASRSAAAAAAEHDKYHHLDTHSRLGRKVSREDEMPYPYPYTRDPLHYDYQRDCLSPGSRMRSFPGSLLYEREHGHDHHSSSSSSSSRYLKRKYTMEHEENRLDTVSNNQYYRDQDEDARHSTYSRRTQMVYDDDDDEFFYDPTDEFIHDDDHHPHKYAKGYSSGLHSNRRNRWKNEPINESREDTMEFKELVNDYFLSFTKKLNENPVVRRRYMEQGSLFCIVCGRSVSKEFLDAKGLAMHAFMSHKSGLRAQHLGLLKAICVMLGWNTLIPSTRWFPEPLSATQTLAQKQDLIIWPPLVIVHNISNNTSNGEAVEALGQYLRGLGLSGGKVVKLGKPGIMLVKFLGTFSGLQDAEKIHMYFSNKKHGRKQLEQMSWGKSRNREVLFGGYMGTAQDLDKVDINTKRKSSIKSKKEIQDIADAPVKPKPAAGD